MATSSRDWKQYYEYIEPHIILQRLAHYEGWSSPRARAHTHTCMILAQVTHREDDEEEEEQGGGTAEARRIRREHSYAGKSRAHASQFSHALGRRGAHARAAAADPQHGTGGAASTSRAAAAPRRGGAPPHHRRYPLNHFYTHTSFVETELHTPRLRHGVVSDFRLRNLEDLAHPDHVALVFDHFLQRVLVDELQRDPERTLVSVRFSHADVSQGFHIGFRTIAQINGNTILNLLNAVRQSDEKIGAHRRMRFDISVIMDDEVTGHALRNPPGASVRHAAVAACAPLCLFAAAGLGMLFSRLRIRLESYGIGDYQNLPPADQLPSVEIYESLVAQCNDYRNHRLNKRNRLGVLAMELARGAFCYREDRTVYDDGDLRRLQNVHTDVCFLLFVERDTGRRDLVYMGNGTGPIVPLVNYATTQEFDHLIAIKPFYNKMFCGGCRKFWPDLARHTRCNGKCDLCGITPGLRCVLAVNEGPIGGTCHGAPNAIGELCDDCGKTFLNADCMARHREVSQREGGRSRCQRYKRCPDCGIGVDTVSNPAHKCGASRYCYACEDWRKPQHECFHPVPTDKERETRLKLQAKARCVSPVLTHTHVLQLPLL